MAFEGMVFVTGFKQKLGSLQLSKKIQPGDILMGVNNVSFPSIRGFVHDVESLNHMMYPLTLRFVRHERIPMEKNQNSNGFFPPPSRHKYTSKRIDIILDKRVDQGSLGVIWARTRNGQPFVKSWHHIPSADEASGQINVGDV